ncbi:uncharacterized protein [Epargyreus clarus]|uniref:uncharacterized protein n=1 Tax=Epargyreus clarus TaxID=520877 RepID=UPI003C303E1B
MSSEKKRISKFKKPDKTSIFNKYVMCDHCEKKEPNKQKLKVHIKDCVTRRTCTWCNIVFRNRGNLYSHSLHLHGKNLGLEDTQKYFCTVCPKSYAQTTNLKYHVRKDHYNMKAKVVEGELREINAVWVERVQNSDALIEITKTGPSTYLMKKTTHTDAVVAPCTDTIDLSMLYPTCSRVIRVPCHLCKKTYYKRDFKKHINEKHKNVKKHKCNNCSKGFKRVYQYLKHVCNKKPGRQKSFKINKQVGDNNNSISV